MQHRKLSSAVAMLALVAPIGASIAQDRVSRPGAYSGYSPVLYDGYRISSQYVTMRDGTKIAIDVIRPTKNGVLVDAKLPVVWMNTPYNRRIRDQGLTAELYPGSAMALVKYGYVVAIADMRGNFASFGRAVASRKNHWIPWSYWDAYDITEWLADQPYADGKVGMWGCSATGHTQWQAAASAPPHLKAIFPLSAPSEYYSWGGVVASAEDDAASDKIEIARVEERQATAVPVDEDRDGTMLKAARAAHQNFEAGYMPFRDSPSPAMAEKLGMKDFRYSMEVNTYPRLGAVSKSGIAIYQSSNLDEEIRNKHTVFAKYRSIANPQKLILAPGKHCEWTSPYVKAPTNGFDISVEELRWFDYWLKGVANGIMDEPPIYYFTVNQPAATAWRFAWQWPLPTERRVNYYFGAGTSALAGTLSTAMPTAEAGKDDYKVDYDVTPENLNERAIRYTTAPLERDMTLVGHPVIDVTISSTATDGDFVAFLADVGPDGKVTMLPGTSDGRLRASHRALGTPPHDSIGLPYHPSFAADIKPLVPGQPTQLTFDMAPLTYTFKQGHSIRLLITSSAFQRRDEPRLTPVLTPAPVVSFYHNAAHRSFITLPLSAPVAATAQITADGTARVRFPKSLDRRYIADVKRGSVTVNGAAAKSVAVAGEELLVTFDPGNVRAGQAVTISGAFGDKYYYGDEAAFAATARVPAR